MFLELLNQDIKVFLADVTSDMTNTRHNLSNVLQRAGIEVVVPNDKATADEIRRQIDACDCTIHLLGVLNFYNESGAGYDSSAGLQYRIARAIKKDGFKMFFWNPSGLVNSRNLYVNNIRRDIVENTIYSATTSEIVFVEELRTIMSVKPKPVTDLRAADIYFIYNDLDKETAGEILSMLSDLQTVKGLSINMSFATEYNDIISGQLSQCKIGVVYYDYAEDWAVSFARQIWKDNGGRGSVVPLFLAANKNHAQEKELNVLKGIMEYSISDKSVIPLDIKIFYDKVTTKN